MLEAALKVLDGEFDKTQYSQVRDITDRVAALDSQFAEAAVSFNGEFHPRLLTLTAGRRWLLSRGLKLFLVKCLNSSRYLEGLKTVLCCAMLKGAQEGLVASIDHGRAGRVLTDIAAHRPSAQADYDSALAVF